jgi:TonB family protein
MSWWHYLLLVNFYLVVFFGFYALLLRRETFFQLNRIYLVAASLLSFFIPLIQSDWVKNLFITKEVQHTIYSAPIIYSRVRVFNVMPAQSSLTIGEVINAIYISVTLFLILRLIWQLVILKKAIEKPSPSAAYSFFKKISLGNKVESPAIIAAHEQVHAGQWHSVDVMIIETVMIINWFNPVVYLYRFAIKYIHEFIADKQVVQAGTDKVDYALLLLSQTFNVPTHSLVNPFYNHSLLKMRILMLQKNRSHRIALVKYGLSAPLFILMMVFSSATIDNSKAVKSINQKTEKIFSTSADDFGDIADHAEIPANITDSTESDPIVENYNKLKDKLRIDSSAMDGNEAFTAVESAPKFPGSLADFLRRNIKYPAAMRGANVQGSVRVQFVVETDGSISNIKAMGNTGYGAGEEAERVMALSPKWKPAYQNGKPIKVMFTVPINFSPGDNEGSTAVDENKIFYSVEKQPQFPGGMEKFSEFLSKNIRYPANMRQANIQGKVVIQFVIETNGSLSNIQVLDGPGYGSGEEAVRVMALSPKWAPGLQNGRAVRVAYTIPVNFTLEQADLTIHGATLDTGARKFTGTAISAKGIKSGVVAFLDVKDLVSVKETMKSRGLDNPVFVIDGVKKDKQAFDNMDLSKVESIVILDKGAITNNNIDTTNGVVSVKLKTHVNIQHSDPKINN